MTTTEFVEVIHDWAWVLFLLVLVAFYLVATSLAEDVAEYWKKRLK